MKQSKMDDTYCTHVGKWAMRATF